MLTEQESLLVRRLFAQGPSALFEEGFTTAQLDEFMSRAEVKRELHLLEQELKHKDILEQRSRFLTRRTMSRLTGGAVAVLGRAMQGPVYVRDNEGNILRDNEGRLRIAEAGIDRTQLDAAKTVLDTLGIGDPKVVTLQDVNVTAILRQHVDAEAKAAAVLDQDPALVKEEQRVLSRERLRNVIQKLLPDLAEARTKIESAIKKEVKDVTPRKGAKKKQDSGSKHGQRPG